MSADPVSRRDELATTLASVRRRVGAAESAAGRGPGEVGLLVVTKYFPASDVRLLAGLGVTDVGENRHQEAAAKATETADLALRRHFIGGLQSNKAGAVAAYADVVESVDRAKLLAPLSRGAAEAGRVVDVLLQVSLDPADQAGARSGVAAPELLALAERAAGVEWLRLAGLMAVAPRGEDPSRAFERLARMREDFLVEHPEARVLSAGMSGDLEQAIAAGATQVRVGSAVLGSRPVVL